MSFFGKPVKPEDVFTPRNAAVNEEMYIDRPDLETALEQGLRTPLNLVLFGDSGTGKSWLYKKHFADHKITYLVANLATAGRLGGISNLLSNLVQRGGAASLVSYETNKEAGLNIPVASASIAQSNTYEVGSKEPFELALEFVRKKADRGQAVLIFDNLEVIYGNDAYMKELGSILILCDDATYAQYKVKVMLVGVPSGVKDYFYNVENLSTVSSRLKELPEVDRLTADKCDDLVYRGFSEKLEYEIKDLAELQRHVRWVSGRIPLLVHEYCLELAFIAQKNGGVVDSQAISSADLAWLEQKHMPAYRVIESHMNDLTTSAGRRNQTLFCLSLVKEDQFKYSDIEALLRQEFPTSTSEIQLNASQILSGLAKTPNPLIKRTPKGDAFTFFSPIYRMVLRTMLVKTSDERVEKRSASDSARSREESSDHSTYG